MEKTIDKNKRALEVVAFDINQFKNCFNKYVCDIAPFKYIGSVVRDTGICVALYYNNMESADRSWCRIMISDKEDSIEDAISYTEYEQEAVEKQITEVIKKKASTDEVFIKFNEVKYNKQTEFSHNYLIAFAAFNQFAANDSQKAFLLRHLIVDFLYQTVDNMKKLEMLFSKGEGELCKTKYNFIKEYIRIVNSHYKLPSEKIWKNISRAGYENRKCTGKIVFLNAKEYDRITYKFDLDEDYMVTNERIARKLLETAKGAYYMAVDIDSGYKIAGYMEIEEENRKNGDVYIIFQGDSDYSILAYPEEVLIYKNGEYYASKEDSIEANLKICKEYKDIPGLKEILNHRNEIDHGAIIIFAEDAADICNKLCKQFKRGFVMDVPFDIQENIDFVIQMAAVDGAVLADNQGKCYAYGVMLDGEAKTIGNPEKGSRYNSSVNYIYGKNRTAVIISEDKDKPVCVENGIRLCEAKPCKILM